MPSVYALKRKHRKLQEAYDLNVEELKRLRPAYASEHNESAKFKYEKRIEQIEAEQKQLERELEELEDLLAHPENIPPFQWDDWDYSTFPIDFSSNIDFLTQNFVGRQDTIERIERFLQEHKSGYLAIIGEAGIGKSALLAHEIKRRGTIHHFVDDKQNSAKDEVFLRSIVEQLRQRYCFEFEERTPISVSEWNIYFQKWIKEISAEEQLIIFVDALDEAQHYGGSDNLLKYLPQELPENVYFILTSRPEFEREEITFLDSTTFERNNLPPLGQTDIEAYLSVRHERLIVPNSSETRTNQEISAILYQKSEGNPLYLHHLLQECENENLTPEQINQLPQSLTKFYEKQWRERIWIGDNTTKEGRRQILCLLLILKEPPNEEMLLELTNLDRAELQDHLIPLRRFMRIGKRYELFHDSFKNFLQYQVEKRIPLYRQELLTYLWRWHELKENVYQYALSWLPSHLAESDNAERLKELLQDLSFVEKKVNEHSVSALQHDFVLLKKKDEPLACLEKSLFRQTHVISQHPKSCVSYLYNYLWGAYPKHTDTWSRWFRDVFNMSPYLPGMYLKRLNHCSGRIDEALIFTFKGHSNSVTSVVFSPDGQRVISGSKDRTFKIWDVDTGALVKTFEGHTQGVNSIAFSPDGRYVVSGSDDQMLKLWDIESGRLIRPFEGHSAEINEVAYSPDGQRIISGSNDRTLKFWDVATGKLLKTIGPHDSEVTAVACSQNGQYVISGYKNRLLKLWNAKTGEYIETFKRYCGEVDAVAFSPDSRCVICGSFEGMLTLWNIDNPEQAIRHFQDADFSPSVAFSPDDQNIVAGSFNSMLILCDVSRGDNLRTFEGHSSTVRTVAFSPDGQQIISGSDDQTLILWDKNAEGAIEMPPQRRSFERTDVAEFSPDGRFMVSATEDKTLILWNADTGKPIKTFEGHSSWIRAVTFSPDSQFIISGSGDGEVKLWDIPRGTLIETFQVHFPGISALAIAADGEHIISGRRDGALILWNMKTRQVIQFFEGHSDRIHSVAFSPKARYILSCSDDQTLKLWHLNREQPIRTISDHSEKVVAVAFSPDGQHFISGSLEQTLKLWHTDAEHPIKTFQGHSSEVITVAFSQNGQHIASGSVDHTVRLWDIQTGINVAKFVGEAPIICTRFGSDGKEIWATDHFRAPRIYKFEIVRR